jgi:uncharacterized protein (UPF0335 family)
MMQRIRERLVEESQRLDEDVARLAQEATRLVDDAKHLGEDVSQLVAVAERLDRDAGRLGDQTAAMNDRLTALRSLVNDLLNTATLAEGVEYVHRAEQPEKVSER